MFEHFKLEMIDVGPGALRVRHGGSGPPILLLHGHPRTHMTWGLVADQLADRFTVVCPDLRGFGRSFQPTDAVDSANSSKRAKAEDCIALMRALGHEKFSVVGHDRGSYVAYRLTIDHPECVDRLVIIDCIPIIEHLDRLDWRFAKAWYHWFFFAQPDKPERAINADPLAWYDALRPDLMGAEAYEDLIDVIRNPAVVHGMIEDYRAGLAIDRKHEEADRDAGRRVICPMLCVWSSEDDLQELCGDPMETWRNWATDVVGGPIESGHHVAEENPIALADLLGKFLA